MADLKKEFEWYLSNQKELVQKYNGKVLLIKGQMVDSVYDNEMNAYSAATTKFEPGSFLIQKCSPGDRDYSQTFHSRAVFH